MSAEPSLLLLEEAGFASWPAHEVRNNGSWRVHLSPGVATKRINSINCLNANDGDLAQARLADCLDQFGAHDLTPILRMTPLTPQNLIEAAIKTGFGAPFDESLVMTASASGFQQPDQQLGFCTIANTPDADWVAGYCQAHGKELQDATNTISTMQRIAQPAAFVKMMQGEQCVGIGVGVVQGDLVGLFGVRVSLDHRRAGIGRLLCQHIFAWGREQGAKTVWLQVEADNAPAVKLYSALGFTERYRYAYRKLEA